MPCAGRTAAEEKACGSSFLSRFGRRAFRRPLTESERRRLVDFFNASLAAYGYDAAVQMSIELVLQAPQFLYRIETGGQPSPGRGVVALTQHELATRLSYFLTDGPPDGSCQPLPTALD